MNNDLLDAVFRHARADYPREICGVLYVRKGREVYQPITNVAHHNEHFVMDPDELADIEDAGEILAIVHSHCDLPAAPSEADLAGCEQSGKPWHIVAVHQTIEGGVVDAGWVSIAPIGYQAPLYGRPFCHGVLDCWAFLRDWYAADGLVLPNYARRDRWWLAGENLYLDHLAAAGFQLLRADAPLQRGDMLLMQVASPVPNHAAVVLGDGCIGQHLQGRLSSRDVYGGWFQKITTHRCRHLHYLPPAAAAALEVQRAA